MKFRAPKGSDEVDPRDSTGKGRRTKHDVPPEDIIWTQIDGESKKKSRSSSKGGSSS